MGKKSKDTITINRKALAGFFSLAGITVVLIARNDPAVILMFIGAAVGIFIGKHLD